MAEGPDPIQQQLIEARRKQILEAAVHVFAEKGFHRATIRDIARQAGIADGTIYNYFSNKTDLLIAILDLLNESDQRSEHFVLEEGDGLREFFVRYLHHRLSVMVPNYRILQAVLPEILVNAELRDLYYQRVIAPTVQIGEQFLQVMVEQGHIRAVDAPLAIRALASTILGLLLNQMLGDQLVAERWEELPEVLATLMLDGLLIQEKSND